MKPNGKGGDFSGPIIKKILHNNEILEDLDKFDGEKYSPLIDCLNNLGYVHDLCRKASLDPNFKYILHEFTIIMKNATKSLGFQKL